MFKRLMFLFTFFVAILGYSEPLRVGMEAGYAPFNWFQNNDSNGAVKINGGYAGGYDVEIAKIIAKELNRELVIVQSDWDSLLGPALNSNKIDVVIAGMSATKERKENLDFTDTYYDSDLVIVVKKDSKYVNSKKLLDFKDAKITAQLNTFHYDVIDQIEGVNKQNPQENFSTMLVALSSGKIDGYVSERPGAISASVSNPDITFVEFSDDNGFKYEKNDVAVSVALKKGNIELRDKINEILKTIDKNKREEIMKKAIQTQPNNNIAEDESSISKTPNTFLGWIQFILQNYYKQLILGTLTTVLLSFVGTFFGFFIGLFFALIRTITKNNFITNLFKKLINLYITIVRGTPMIVQAIIFYYGFSQATGINISILASSLIIVSFNTAAYIAEIIRGGIDSIDKGQYEATKALGMNHYSAMRYVILPQAIRNTLPSVGNELIVNIKDTSVLFSIGVTELYTTSRFIAGTHSRYYEVFIITCSIYFILTYGLSKLFIYLEKKIDGMENYEIAE